MNCLIKIICIFILLVSTLFAKVIYVSYSDEFKITTQYNTGINWNNNCAAASLYMCLDYMDIQLGSVEFIRNKINPSSGWLYTDELEEYLDDNGVEYSIRHIWDTDTLIKAIDNGVVMLCVNASLISGKDYSGVTGHFIVVVGYIKDSKGCKLEVYDPMSREVKYYDLEEVFAASENWWRWLFLFEK